jgi:hypothetical protein
MRTFGQTLKLEEETMRTRIVLLALIVLVACPKPPTPEQVNFNTDPRIFRGVWVGTVQDYPQSGQATPVKLNLEPEQIYQGSSYDTYNLSGTITLGNDAPLVLVGVAVGNGQEQYLRPQTSPVPPPGMDASIYNAQGKKTWNVSCTRIYAISNYLCWLQGPDPAIQMYFRFEIQRQP